MTAPAGAERSRLETGQVPGCMVVAELEKVEVVRREERGWEEEEKGRGP